MKINFNQAHNIDHFYLWPFAIFWVISLFHRCRNSAVYCRKTWPSDFQQHFGWPIFYYKRVLQRPKQMVVRWCKVGALQQMHQNFPNKFYQFVSSHQKCAWPHIAMMEHNSFSIGQFWLLFLDWFVQTVELCTIQDQIDGFTTLQQFVMDISFPIPPNTQHNLVYQLFRLWSQFWRVTRLWLWSLAFDIITFHPIFISCNDLIQKWFDFIGFQQHFTDSNLFNQISLC